MNKSRKTALYVVKVIAMGLLAIILVFGLLYAILLGIFRILDRKDARVTEEIIVPKAAEYISQTYPDSDYVLGNAYYAFKDNCYRVKVHSPSSQDTYFELEYDYKTYEFIQDSYESSVLSGYNTRNRLVNAYTQLVDDCLSSVTCLSDVQSDFCEYNENTSHYGYFSPNGLDSQTLILDKAYDVAKLGTEYGFLEITAVLPREDVNIRSARNILTEIDGLLAESNIGYYSIKITIVDAAYSDTTVEFYLYDIHPEDLNQEDSLSYLQELWNSQESLRQEKSKEQTD